MGLMQSLEVFKLITGAGEPLVGRLLLFEALEHDLHRAQGEEGSELPDLRPGRSRGRR